MIRVNLLRNTGLDAAVVGGPGMQVVAVDQQRIAIVKLVVILLFVIALYIYEKINISNLQQAAAEISARVTEVEAKIAQYGDQGPRVEKFTKEKQRIGQHLEGVEAIAKDRLREVKALDNVQSITPVQVWFEKIVIRNGLVQAIGYSNTDEGVANFYAQLQNSPMFSSFEPKSQEQETVNGAKAMKFEVEFRIGKAMEAAR
ncbi:MAG: PilN domain-containing protein [Bdellovibrionota bacterium]